MELIADPGGRHHLFKLRDPPRMLIEKVTPDHHEMHVWPLTVDLCRGRNKGVVPLPRDKVRHHADDRPLSGQPETLTRGGTGHSGEAFRIDPIVDHADPAEDAWRKDFHQVFIHRARDSNDARGPLCRIASDHGRQPYVAHMPHQRDV